MSGAADTVLAEAVVKVLPDCSWIGTGLAHSFLALRRDGQQAAEEAARKRSVGTHAEIRQLLAKMDAAGFEAALEPRMKLGSAENPATKLFPAAITERHFAERLKRLVNGSTFLTYEDERDKHSLVDFVIKNGSDRLPINVKNAGTPFLNAKKLVGLEPEDCIPIPAYKAYGALEKEPHLLYAICMDHSIVDAAKGSIPPLFTAEEASVWDLLERKVGKNIKKAEDAFVGKVVDNHWAAVETAIPARNFRVISACRAISILRDKPKRTPGIGLRAWGTSARGETNVHISISAETRAWEQIEDKLQKKGLAGVLSEINRMVSKPVSEPLL